MRVGLKTGLRHMMCSGWRDVSRCDLQAAHVHGHGACSLAPLRSPGERQAVPAQGPRMELRVRWSRAQSRQSLQLPQTHPNGLIMLRIRQVSLAKISEWSRLAHPNLIPEVDTYWRRPLGFHGCWFTGSGLPSCPKPAPHALPRHSGPTQAPSSGAPL